VNFPFPFSKRSDRSVIESRLRDERNFSLNFVSCLCITRARTLACIETFIYEHEMRRLSPIPSCPDISELFSELFFLIKYCAFLSIYEFLSKNKYREQARGLFAHKPCRTSISWSLLDIRWSDNTALIQETRSMKRAANNNSREETRGSEATR